MGAISYVEAFTLQPARHSPLALAGYRLDATAREFTALSATPTPDEERFGQAEAAYLTARDDFMAELSRVTGMDAKTLNRRVNA